MVKYQLEPLPGETSLFGTSSSSFRRHQTGVLAYDHTFDGSSSPNNNGSAGIPLKRTKIWRRLYSIDSSGVLNVETISKNYTDEEFIATARINGGSTTTGLYWRIFFLQDMMV